MKTRIILISLYVLSFVGLQSCDSNKSKAEDLATQFVSAFNEGDKATVYEIFPSIKTYGSLSMEGSIGQGDDVSVEKEDSTGYYIATINKQKAQRLIFSVDSIGVITIIDTYGVFHLDSIASELALKAGVPVKKISDVTLAKLMDPEGDFIRDVKLMKGSNNLDTNSGAYSWGHNSSGYYVSMDFTVRNNSTQFIHGKDYYLVVTPRDWSTGATHNPKTVDGVDIAPGEIREFNVLDPPLYRVASNRNLSYSVEIKYRTESLLSYLLHYCSFDGNEYNDYLAHPYRAKFNESGKFCAARASDERVVYAYKEMSEDSEPVDTLYHGQPISIIFESEKWASLYSPDYQLIGYIKAEDMESSEDMYSFILELTETPLISDNGTINIYEGTDEASTEKVVKTYRSGQKALLHFDEWPNIELYERQPDGSMKKIGYVRPENVEDEFD